MRHIRLFWLLTTFSLKKTLMNPMSIVILLVGKFLRFGMFFLFVWYLMTYTKVLSGFTPNQVLLFYLTFMIVDTFAQFMFREVSRFKRLLVSGEFDSILLKPHHPFLRILVGGMDIVDLVLLCLYVGLAVYFISQLTSVSFVHILLYMALLMNAFVIVASIHIAILSLGILMTEVENSIMIYRDVTRLGMFPIDMYQKLLQFILTFVLPVGIMITVPVKGLLNVLDPSWYWISLFCALALLLSSNLFWRFSLKYYQSWGG